MNHRSRGPFLLLCHEHHLYWSILWNNSWPMISSSWPVYQVVDWYYCAYFLSYHTIKSVMIAQGENESHCLFSPWPGSIPDHGGVFRGIFSDWSHTLGEEMGAAKSSQAHLKIKMNTKQYRFFWPQVPFRGLKALYSLNLIPIHWYIWYMELAWRYRCNVIR